MKLDLREDGPVYTLTRISPGKPRTMSEGAVIYILPNGCLLAETFGAASWWRTSIVQDIKKDKDGYTIQTMNSVYTVKRTKYT